MLSNHLLLYVIEFLDLSDYYSLILVNKKFNQLINENSTFWTRECINRHFSFELDAFSEFYESDEYKANLKERVEKIHKKVWRKYVEEGKRIRFNLLTLLKQYSTPEKAEQFVNYFYETFQKPCIPMPKLKRENVVCNTQTMFQNKLAEVLYEEGNLVGNGIYGCDPVKEIIDNLQEHEPTFLEELSFGEKNDVLKARWYIHESKDINGEESIETISTGDKSDMSLEFLGMKRSSEQNDETQIIKSTNSFLLSFYETLQQAITHQCSMIFEYLCSLENIYDVVAEYSARWNTYVATALELESIFETFTKMFNQQYEKLFPYYPCYPKFSIWRLMVKIWFKEIFEKSQFSQALHEGFLSILSNYREKIVKKMVKDNVDAMEIEESLANMPKILYLNLHTSRPRKSSESISTHSFNFQKNAHPFFNFGSENEKRLLNKYVQSILDLSFNEVNIHYIDCTDMNTNSPYSDLEASLIQMSKEFYDENRLNFEECPNYFTEFLKGDAEFLSQILHDRTYAKIRRLQIQTEIEFLQSFIRREIGCIKDFDDNNIMVDENKMGMNPLKIQEFENFVCNFLEENQIEIPVIQNEFDSNDVISSCASQNRAKIAKMICCNLEKQCSSMIKNFEILNEKFKQVEEIKARDAYVKEENMARNIPAELSDMDSFFYDLEKNVDLNVLNKLNRDYVDQIKKNNENDFFEEIPSLKRSESVLAQNDNFYQNIPNVLDLEFFDQGGEFNPEEGELLGLEPLVLRRGVQ